MSLKKKIINGGLWNGLSQFGAQGISFVFILILARFLSPEEFGLLGMVSVITGFFGYFSECGLIFSIIKKKEIDELDCNTAFWGGIVFGVIVYVFIYAISPYIALFYNQPELTNLSRVLALAFIMGSYTFVPFALEQKQLQYKKLSIIRLISLLVSGGVAIFFAVRGAGVWALVFQQLSMKIVTVIATFFWMSWKPKFQFSYTRFKGLFGFGMHVTVNNLIRFFSENIDYLLVGKLLGSEALGIYTMAFRLSRYPIEKMGPVLGRMLMPAFALMQDNPEQIRTNVLRISAFVALITAPFLVFLFFTTEPLVTLVVGEKWLGAVPLIKIFSVYILFLSFSFADEAVLMIKGKIVSLNVVKMLMSLLLLVVGYFIVDKMGIIGMAMAYSVILSLYYVVLKIMTLDSIEMSGKFYLQSMRRIFSYAIVLFSVTYLIWVGLIKNEFSTMVGIGLAVVLIMGVMIIPYFKIITFKPLHFKIDNCLGVIKDNYENIFFAAFGIVILIAVVSFTYLNIIPVNPLQVATYQWFIALWN